MTDDSTDDALLNGRVRLRQPARGYRVAIDPVLLAASVPASPGDHVLDAGCGVGAAALCLAARVPGCRLVGLDIDPKMLRLARHNIAANDLGARMTVIAGDIRRRPPAGIAETRFDHVMANPPYLEVGRAARSSGGDPCDDDWATVERHGDLDAWIAFCLALARDGGCVTLIHRADRLDALLARLAKAAGRIVVIPLWPDSGGRRPAKRVIVRAIKGRSGPLTLTPGLVLHEADGRYTAAAEAILRRGQALAPGDGRA